MTKQSSPVLVGLEIGTSKVCAVVGETTAAGTVNVIGLGQSASRGVRKGEITDPTVAVEAVRKAIAEAEQMAEVEIHIVHLGVTGTHIRSAKGRGAHMITSADRNITEADVQEAIKTAKAMDQPAGTTILHAIRQGFTVDGQDRIINPVGLIGGKLEGRVFILYGDTERLSQSIDLVKQVGLEVDGLVFSGVASALAILTRQQKEQGALVIDLGAGTTDYAVYGDGTIRHAGALPVGGNDVTNDLAHALKIPLSQAERLKFERGSASVFPSTEGNTVSINNEFGLPTRTIEVEAIQRITRSRMEEIFQHIAQDVERAGLLDSLRAGVFLCGGGARLSWVSTLVTDIFDMPANVPWPNRGDRSQSVLYQPEFATAIGVLKFASFQRKNQKAS